MISNLRKLVPPIRTERRHWEDMAELVRSEALSEEAVAKLNEVTDDNKAKKYDRQIRYSVKNKLI